MLGGLSSALSSALAPDVPPVADFRHHWNSFLKYYGENGSDPLRSSRPVEKTHQVHHLNVMMKLLAREQREKENPEDSEKVLPPCMEYLVNHQVLDILSTLCQADVPPGIRPHVIRFFVFLVGHVDQVVLPYVSVYLPIRRLLALFCSGKASPTESQELSFVVSLVANLTKHQELLTLFAHQPAPGDVSHSSSSQIVSRASSTMELSVMPFLENVKSTSEVGLSASQPLKDYDGRHLLLSAVLNYVDSPDYMIACQAMDALLTVSAFKDDNAAFDAVQGTEICSQTAGRLGSSMSALDECFLKQPFEVSHIEEIKVSWMEAHHLFRASKYGSDDFYGKQELVAFFSWFDYCDDLVDRAHSTIADEIVSAIEESFFTNKFELCFWPTNEEDDGVKKLHVLRMAMLSQMWLHINSEGLAKAYTRWLLGEGDQPEVRDVTRMSLKRKLLEFCEAFDENLSLEALRLFDVLLDRPCQPILESLLLNNLHGRGYFQNYSPESSNMNSWSDEEDEREKLRRVSESKRHSPAALKPAQSFVAGSRTLAPANVSKIINKWLFLYPEELRCNDETMSSTYQQYVANAETQVKLVFENCEGFEWPSEAINVDRPQSETSSLDSKPEAERGKRFYEGDFLSMLFDMVENMLENTYDINLQLTAIISKLALLPHPNVHEYLLNPTIPLIDSHPPRTLYSSLGTVLNKGKESSESIPNLQKKIFACKRNLLGSPQVVSSPTSDKPELSLNEKETRLIDALIVLEEFCKELAAITLVKFNIASVE